MRKQILSLAVALLIGSTVCMAQNRQNGKADREKRMEQIVADLGLNEKQAKDFKAAMKEMRPAKNKSNERPTREEMQNIRNTRICVRRITRRKRKKQNKYYSFNLNLSNGES